LTNSFSDDTKRIISNARFIAERFRHDYISTTHVLLGLIAYRLCNAVEILEEYLDIDVDELNEVAEKSQTPEFDKVITGPLPFTAGTKRMMEYAFKMMADNDDEFVEPFHLLQGIVKDNMSECALILKNFDIDDKTLNNAIAKYRRDMGPVNAETPAEDIKERVNRNSTPKRNNKKMLDQFARNLNQLAEDGELDPVIGREMELERMIHILCRRTKQNAVLGGEPGTGKTAVVDGLAQLLVTNQVPYKLKNKVIYSLDMGSLVAGTKYRGEFEKRLQGIMTEVKKDKNIILFIDEIHTVIGAGSAEGTLDASNMIKPALSRGEMQVIGATTMEEYRKHFEKDGALNRRFQCIKIDEPDKETTISILNGLKTHYEEYHGVNYSDDMIKMIVDLCDKYVTDKYFPDKAIDAMDEIGAKLSCDSDIGELVDSYGEKIFNLEEKLKTEKNKTKLKSLEKQLSKMYKEMDEKILENIFAVSEDDVKDTMSMLSGVPLENVASKSDEALRYLNMAEHLKQIIINQDDAIDKISNIIKRSKAGIRDIQRPNVMMLIGPTGTGKSFLAKQLSTFLFGSEENMVYIDCAEFGESHDSSKLIGSPPGYVGYEDAGKFEVIRQNPYSVILLDECEKAHPDIWNIFLRIFEEGVIENSQGTEINFKNCVILMTSNIGSKRFTEPPRAKIGYAPEDSEKGIEVIHKKIKDDVKKHFKPEFLNRIDELVIFNQLQKDDLIRIVKLEIEKLKTRVKEHKNIILDVRPTVFKYIAEEADKESKGSLGARPLRRVIDSQIESQLCDIILENGEDISKITVSYSKKDGIKFTQTTRRRK
jgi:ATP-dependent Clp protease ATP-binding subunit ClpC